MISSITVKKELGFEMEIWFMPLEMCHLLLTLKIIRKRAQICDRFLNILPCSADFTRVDWPTILEV